MKKKLVLLFSLLCAIYAKAYNVGDFYNKDGVKGVVVKVDASGEHGLIMSLDKFSGKWSSDKKAKFETNAFYEDDGEKNMKAIAKYLSESGKTWDNRFIASFEKEEDSDLKYTTFEKILGQVFSRNANTQNQIEQMLF